MKKIARRAAVLGTAVAVAVGGWLLTAPASHAAANSGGVSGQVTLMKGEDAVANRAGLVVYLEGVPGALPDTSDLVYTIHQRDKQFSPGFVVALKGSTVDFPNDDKIFHNVFSLSRPARFDLGLYKSGASKSVKMKRAGVVDVYCNIHPQMVSKILVLETKYHAVTTSSGRFSIQGVPAGSYDVVGWQPHGQAYKGRVTIRAGQQTSLSFTLQQGKKDTEHKRKDGTPYGRYE